MHNKQFLMPNDKNKFLKVFNSVNLFEVTEIVLRVCTVMVILCQ